MNELSISEVVGTRHTCPMCGSIDHLAFVNDTYGPGLSCDNCGGRFEVVAKPSLQEIDRG